MIHKFSTVITFLHFPFFRLERPTTDHSASMFRKRNVWRSSWTNLRQLIRRICDWNTSAMFLTERRRSFNGRFVIWPPKSQTSKPRRQNLIIVSRRRTVVAVYGDESRVLSSISLFFRIFPPDCMLETLNYFQRILANNIVAQARNGDKASESEQELTSSDPTSPPSDSPVKPCMLSSILPVGSYSLSFD